MNCNCQIILAKSARSRYLNRLSVCCAHPQFAEHTLSLLSAKSIVTTQLTSIRSNTVGKATGKLHLRQNASFDCKSFELEVLTDLQALLVISRELSFPDFHPCTEQLSRAFQFRHIPFESQPCHRGRAGPGSRTSRSWCAAQLAVWLKKIELVYAFFPKETTTTQDLTTTFSFFDFTGKEDSPIILINAAAIRKVF